MARPRPTRRVPAADLLLEIGTEEIPARFLPSLRRQLRERAEKALVEAALPARECTVYATPRRLAILLCGVPGGQSDREVESVGPMVTQAFGPDGKPTPAAEGFARKCGVPVAHLVRIESEKGPRLAHTSRIKGRPAAEVLPPALAAVIGALEVPKSMRWPQGTGAFARPIRWLLALHGKNLLPVAVGEVRAAAATRGRRFVHPMPLPVRSAADYLPVLKRAGIMVDGEARKALIRAQADRLATKAGGRVLWDEDLLGEVADLVEAPVAVMGTFPADALAIPQPILVAAMQEHQRYFPVEGKDGTLLPRFITVANGVNTRSVVAGNERVLKARLADARFFHEADRKKRLEEFVPALAGVVWQAGAGSMFDKAKRMQALAAWLAAKLGVRNPAILTAALQAKADLVTAMVGEFPTLQGTVGGLYAAASGESEDTARAIAEHYRPTGPKDEVPGTLEGCVVALADKIDHLAGHLVLEHAPSGTADPYALRRAGLGIIRILAEHGWRLPLRQAFVRAAERHEAGKDEKVQSRVGAQAVGFLRGRMEIIFAEQGFQPDEIVAALVAFDDVTLAGARLRALAVLKGRPGFRETVLALSRVTNILPKGFEATPVDPDALDAAERTLHELHLPLSRDAEALAAAGGFEALYDRLAALRPAIDAFFAAVMVNDPDAAVRQRRLSLLAEIAKTIRLLADIKALALG